MKRLFERLVYHDLDGRGRLSKVRQHSEPIYSRGFVCFGVLFNPAAFWIGAHYSEYHQRLCINLLPCLTVWVCGPKGMLP